MRSCHGGRSSRIGWSAWSPPKLRQRRPLSSQLCIEASRLVSSRGTRLSDPGPSLASQALFGTLTLDVMVLTVLYSIAGLGIAIVNDFKSIEVCILWLMNIWLGHGRKFHDLYTCVQLPSFMRALSLFHALCARRHPMKSCMTFSNTSTITLCRATARWD